VASAYGIDCIGEPCDLGGSSNLNVLIRDDGDRYVVRVYRPHVSTGRLRAIHVVRYQLSAAGIPCGGIVPTLDGQPWILFEDRLVEVERFVEHDAYMDSWERLESGLGVLGSIHGVLRHLEMGDVGKAPMFANHLPSTDALDRTSSGTQRIRTWDPSPAELQLAHDAEELARLVSTAERPLNAKLPTQLVHGDFWDNNVLFRDGSVVFITDFDYMGERARIDDLALTLYFTCMEFFEDPVSDDQLRRLSRLLDAYEAGSSNSLTATERAALPLAMARQPLWSIGGWVASLDDEGAARQHAAGTVAEVAWALGLMQDLPRWQAAFAARTLRIGHRRRRQ
jgi:homoserine kinase type II